MTFDEFERRVRSVGHPPFNVTEAALASEASWLPSLLFLLATHKLRIDFENMMICTGKVVDRRD